MSKPLPDHACGPVSYENSLRRPRGLVAEAERILGAIDTKSQTFNIPLIMKTPGVSQWKAYQIRSRILLELGENKLS